MRITIAVAFASWNFLLFLSLSNNGFGGMEGEKGGSILWRWKFSFNQLSFKRYVRHQCPLIFIRTFRNRSSVEKTLWDCEMENSEDHAENKEHWILDLCKVFRKYVLWFKFNLWFEIFKHITCSHVFVPLPVKYCVK